MEEKEIIEGNKLIMLFDGWIRVKQLTFTPIDNPEEGCLPNEYWIFKKDGVSVLESDILYDIVYHKSWNALMPVVEKIRGLGFTVSINVGIGHFNDIKIYIGLGQNPLWVGKYSSENTPIECVWLAVVRFIKWHNSNN